MTEAATKLLYAMRMIFAMEQAGLTPKQLTTAVWQDENVHSQEVQRVWNHRSGVRCLSTEHAEMYGKVLGYSAQFLRGERPMPMDLERLSESQIENELLQELLGEAQASEAPAPLPLPPDEERIYTRRRQEIRLTVQRVTRHTKSIRGQFKDVNARTVRELAEKWRPGDGEQTHRRLKSWMRRKKCGKPSYADCRELEEFLGLDKHAVAIEKLPDENEERRPIPQSQVETADPPVTVQIPATVVLGTIKVPLPTLDTYLEVKIVQNCENVSVQIDATSLDIEPRRAVQLMATLLKEQQKS